MSWWKLVCTRKKTGNTKVEILKRNTNVNKHKENVHSPYQ